MARIAIVDNSKLTISSLRACLTERGHDVRSAMSADEARALAHTETMDAWIVDIRLRDNTDDKDFSGLRLAKELNSRAPKIILTNYPSWQTVREALGSDNGRAPAAVSFVSKKEGLDALLQRLDLALAPPDDSLLQTLGVPAMHAVPDRLAELGPEQAGEKLRTFIDTQRAIWRQRQDLEIQRASHYHWAGLAASGAGFFVLLVGMACSLIGKVSTATVATCGGLLVNIVSALFLLSADKAHQRLKESLPQTERLLELANILELCNTFETPELRDRNRQLVFDRFLAMIANPAGASR
jgi:CheY-like chemotaxis protein